MRVYIHCGPPRTGTSSFQMLLSRIGNIEGKLLLPEAGRDPHSWGIVHHLLMEYDEQYRSNSLGEFNLNLSAIDLLVKELNDHPFSNATAVISSERFASLRWDQVQLLATLLKDHEVVFVFCQRDFVDLHLSIWKKRVEMGLTETIKQSMLDIWPALQYMAVTLPELVKRSFGSESLRFINYSKIASENLKNICDILGIADAAESIQLERLVVMEEILSASLSKERLGLCLAANIQVAKELYPNSRRNWVREEHLEKRDALIASLEASGDNVSLDYKVEGESYLRDFYERIANSLPSAMKLN